MCPVRATATPAGFVHLHVGHNKLVRLEALDLSVGLCVLEQAQKELAALLRPATDGSRDVLALRVTLHAKLEADKRNDLFLVDDILEILLGARQGHVLDRSSGLSRVLKVNTQIAPARLRGYLSKDVT